MNTAKEDVEQLLKELSDDCTLEDIHYLYVIEKVLVVASSELRPRAPSRTRKSRRDWANGL